MATKSTLENQVIALMAQVESLTKAQATTPPEKAKAAAKPLVARGYFKTHDEATDKWLDDTTRPCIVVSVPGAKPRKVTEPNFAKELEIHATIVAAYKALA